MHSYLYPCFHQIHSCDHLNEFQTTKRKKIQWIYKDTKCDLVTTLIKVWLQLLLRALKLLYVGREKSDAPVAYVVDGCSPFVHVCTKERNSFRALFRSSKFSFWRFLPILKGSVCDGNSRWQVELEDWHVLNQISSKCSATNGNRHFS